MDTQIIGYVAQRCKRRPFVGGAGHLERMSFAVGACVR